MQVRRGFLKLALRQALAGTALLTMAAFADPAAQAAQTKDGKTTITVGISVGSAEKIFDVVKQVAARDGLEIELIKFNDYQLPNAALNNGDLDANAFQHKPFRNDIAK